MDVTGSYIFGLTVTNERGERSAETPFHMEARFEGDVVAELTNRGRSGSFDLWVHYGAPPEGFRDPWSCAGTQCADETMVPGGAGRPWTSPSYRDFVVPRYAVIEDLAPGGYWLSAIQFLGFEDSSEGRFRIWVRGTLLLELTRTIPCSYRWVVARMDDVDGDVQMTLLNQSLDAFGTANCR